MPSRIFRYIWKLNPIVLGLLMVFIPFAFMIFYAILTLYRILVEKPEPNLNMIGIGVLIVFIIYLIWSKNVAVFFNQRLVKPFPVSTKFYKWSFWYLVVYLFLETITKTSFINTNFKVNETTYLLLSLTVSFIRFLALIAYIHTNLFTGKIVMSIEKGKEVTIIDSLAYGVCLWVFPLGIPILQYRLKKGSKKNLFK